MAHIRSYAQEKPCENCGTSFRPRKDTTKKGMGKYCSLHCWNQSQKRPMFLDVKDVIGYYQQGWTVQEIAKEAKVGWRVIRKIIQDAGILRQPGQKLTKGYLTTYGPNRERMLVHKLICIQNGTIPEKGEVIHHIDCDKRNNAPGNLEIMDKKSHGLLHRQLEMLASGLVNVGLIIYRKGDGYIFSSEMEEFLNYVSKQ